MSTLQAIVTALDEQLTLTDEEKSVVYSARLFDMEYQQRGTKHLYTVADLVLHAAAFHGSFRIMEGLFALNANLNLFLHGADLLNSVIARASRAGLLSWPDEEAVAGTEETIELIQLLVAHGVPAEEEHLKEAIKGKILSWFNTSSPKSDWMWVLLSAPEYLAQKRFVSGLKNGRRSMNVRQGSPAP